MKTCEVDIFGDKYALRADMNEEYVRSLAHLVDSRMRDVANASPSASSLQVAVLAALDIASETPANTNDAVDNQECEELAIEIERRAQIMLGMITGATS